MSRRFISSLIGAAALVLLVAMSVAGPSRAQDLRYDVDSAEGTLRELRAMRCPATRSGCPLSPQDFTLFERAVGGERAAQHELARRLESGRAFPGSEGDRTAAGWYGRAAEQGDFEAALRYNDLRTKGLASTADEARIAAQLRAPAQSGDPVALQALSEMYLHGRGVERSAEESMRLLRRAADAGNASAQSRLAERLRRGAPGVMSDRAAALEVDRRAATNGDVYALARLGPTLLYGPSETRDPVEAHRWLMRAAHCALVGQPMEYLITLLEEGRMHGARILVAPDLVHAYMWLTIASKVSPQNDRPSTRARLELMMTAAQLTEAKRRAAAWRQVHCFEAVKLNFELPAVTAESERLAALGSVSFYSRLKLLVPPGTTPAPWQRVPDFNSLDDVLAVVAAMAAYCESRSNGSCAAMCRSASEFRDEEAAKYRQRRDLRMDLWRGCARRIV